MQQLADVAKGAGTLTNHLTAELDGTRVVIQGNKARVHLPNKSGPHTFKFLLTDRTGLNVRFAALGTEVGETCPAAPGDNTGQIVDVSIEDRKAEFTDRNDGPRLTFGYTWFFACDDASQQPTFDPIVDNGGNN